MVSFCHYCCCCCSFVSALRLLLVTVSISVQTMQAVNKKMDPQKTLKTMQDFQKENMKMGMTEEMSKDTHTHSALVFTGLPKPDWQDVCECNMLTVKHDSVLCSSVHNFSEEHPRLLTFPDFGCKVFHYLPL